MPLAMAMEFCSCRQNYVLSQPPPWLSQPSRAISSTWPADKLLSETRSNCNPGNFFFIISQLNSLHLSPFSSGRYYPGWMTSYCTINIIRLDCGTSRPWADMLRLGEGPGVNGIMQEGQTRHPRAPQLQKFKKAHPQTLPTLVPSVDLW